jgi:hypothetical protein
MTELPAVAASAIAMPPVRAAGYERATAQPTASTPVVVAVEVDRAADKPVVKAAEAVMPVTVKTRTMKMVPRPKVAPPHGYGLALGAFDLRQRHCLDWSNWNCECGRNCRHRKHELEHVPLRGLRRDPLEERRRRVLPSRKRREFYCSAQERSTRSYRSPLMPRESPHRTAPWARTVHGAAMPTKLVEAEPRTELPPAPEMFDVITFFLNRGDSWTVIASIGFWTAASPRKALSAPALRRWYQNERTRRSASHKRGSRRSKVASKSGNRGQRAQPIK